MTSPSIEQIKHSMRATWMAGDFGVIAKSTAKIAAEFVDALPVTAGARALDVACGTGNLAIPLAQRSLAVTGVDIAPNLLAQARERAAVEGLPVQFDEGDAEKLPYDDATFDVVVTMFGAMFAPRPELVAAEIARVLKPGGLLAMANWDPASFSADLFNVTGRHVAPPAALPQPVLWGDVDTVRQRLGGVFENIETEIVPIMFDFPTDEAGVVAIFRNYFGPTQAAFARLDETGQKALAADLEALWATANMAESGSGRTVIQNQFLKVTATRADA